MLFCYLKFNVFDKHREKYTKPDFVKFISLEINYFVETRCFGFFFKNIDTLLFQVTKLAFPPSFFVSYFFIHFFSLRWAGQLLLDNFLGGQTKNLAYFLN